MSFFVDETTDFRLVPLVRQAFLDNKFDVFQEIRDKVHFWPTGPNFFKNIPEKQHLVYWTENHLAGILSTEYLVAQHFHEKLTHNRLEQFLESRVKYGSSEYLSVAYQAYTMAGILNIVDFCTDEKLQSLATQFCDIITKQYAYVINPFTGNVASAGGRMYAYMRRTTDKLKISPLCYLLVGQPERMNQFDPKKFTLAHALKTTTYKVPNEALRIIEERREPGTHTYSVPLTAASLSVDEPIWVCWTYGQYANMSRAIETIRFFYEHGLHYHHHFHGADKLFGLGRVSVLMIQIFLLIFYLLFALLFYMFGTVSWLTNVTLETATHVQDKSVVVITAAVPKNVRGRPAAQQFPCQILVNDMTVYTNFGQIMSGVKKEMSGMSMMPHVNLDVDNDVSTLHVQFSSYNPVFALRSRNDKLEVIGIDEAKNKYPEWTIRIEKQTPKELRLTVRKTEN
jgi:hypothetical protein